MGLFDKLRKTIEDVAAEAGKNKDDLQREIEKVLGTKPQQTSGSPQMQSPQADALSGRPYHACAVYPSSTDQTQRVYEIICRNFPQLQVQCHVPVNSLVPAAHPKCLPITFLLSQNNVPRVAVLLMHHQQHGGKKVIGTDSACAEQLGIRYIHLYHEYENAEDYVVNQIRLCL